MKNHFKNLTVAMKLNKKYVLPGMTRSRGWALWIHVMAAFLACPAKAQTPPTIPVGWGPNAVVVNSGTNQIYVTNGFGNSMTIINGATNATTTIPLVASPQALAVNSLNRVYVAVSENLNGSVVVIDGNTESIIATVPVGRGPSAVAIDPNTDFVYVTNAIDNTVTVINGDAYTRPDGTILPANSVFITDFGGGGPAALAVNPATSQVFVAASDSNQVVEINGNPALAVVPRGVFPVGSNPESVAVNSLTNKVYIANNNDARGTITVINPVPPGATTTVVVEAPCGDCMIKRVGVNQRLNKFYGVDYLDRSVYSMDGATNSVLAHVFVGVHPNAIAMDDSRSRAYVASDYGVDPINTANDTDLGLIPVGQGPHELAVNTVTGKVYVTNMADNTLSVITPIYTIIPIHFF
jgi:YVTN family beta-propeller protein